MNYHEKIKCLKTVKVGTGYRFDKNFIYNLNPETDPSEKQKIWIDKLLYKYRRQIFSNKDLLKVEQMTFIAYVNNHEFKKENKL